MKVRATGNSAGGFKKEGEEAMTDDEINELDKIDSGLGGVASCVARKSVAAGDSTDAGNANGGVDDTP